MPERQEDINGKAKRPSRAAYQRAQYAANREKYRARARQRYLKNPKVHVLRVQEWKKEKRQRDPLYVKQKSRQSVLKKRYNMTLTDQQVLLENQQGRCAICKETLAVGCQGKLCLCVDHDAKTGRVRGLLCRSCNFALGLLQHSPALLQQAARYLLAAWITE